MQNYFLLKTNAPDACGSVCLSAPTHSGSHFEPFGTLVGPAASLMLVMAHSFVPIGLEG